MGSAMLSAWLKAGFITHIDVLDPNGLPSDLNATNITAHIAEQSFMANASTWDMLIIAIKPQTMESFSTAIQKFLPSALPVLSIAAGQTIASLTHRFSTSQPIIRAMPNTPAAIGKGITVACANTAITAAQKTIATNLLSTLGQTEWITDETQLDAVTALSGSGPAYVFYLIETMAKAGTEAGLPFDFAMKLARQTVIGAAALAEQEPQTSASILRENVTSPGGTTAAALSILMDGNFQKIMCDAIAKATVRSKELAK